MIAQLAEQTMTETSTSATVIPFPAPAAPATSTTDTSTGALAARALIVDLTISQWSAVKNERSVAEQVAQQNGSDPDMGKFTKFLLDSKALKSLRSIVEGARAEHRERTVPWLDNGGGRAIKNEGVLPYVSSMKAWRDKFNAALDDFERDYPSLKNEAARKLGSLFNASEYPGIGEIRSKFSFEWLFIPLATSGDFRVEMADEDKDKLAHYYEQKAQEWIANGQRELIERIKETVGRVATRLRDYQPPAEGGNGRLHDSVLDNVRDLCTLIPTLNLTNDPEIDALATEMRERVLHFSTETVKASTAARAKTADAAAEIVAKVEEIGQKMGAFI